MIFFSAILTAFWFIRTTKVALFYIYLWQLKEYQVRRFLDHFRTAKGKQLLLNKINLLKLVLVVVFFLHTATFFYLLLILYFIESLKAFLDIYKKRLRRPAVTKKTAVLIFAAIFLEILFILLLFLKIKTVFWFPFWFLIFDILAPLIFSLVVLVFQPPTVFLRNQIIKKAKKKRKKFKKLLVVGITGSYGKTSTKEILVTILSERFNVLKTKEHQNSEIGISQCILNELNSKHKIFIVEMGAYGRGGIKLLSNITKPKIGILTGVNEQHLALFGSQENIIKTKYELIESLPPTGTAIFNGVNLYCSKLYKKTKIKKRLCNGNLEKTVVAAILWPDIWAEDIKVEKEFVLFGVRAKGGDSADFKVNLLGRQNVENILLAACCAKELGMSLAEISQACLKIKPEQGAMKFLKKDGLTVLDASYSANSVGVIADLDYLEIYQGKKMIVMPCLIELGKVSKEIHKKIGKRIGEVCDLAIITTKERFEEIKEGAIFGGMKKENILFIEKPKEIVTQLKEFCRSGDVLLLEGRVPKGIIDSLGV